MKSTNAPPTEPADFSLVQGGPLFQLLVRAGLLRPPLDYLSRRIAVLVLLAWLPLLLSLVDKAIDNFAKRPPPPPPPSLTDK